MAVPEVPTSPWKRRFDAARDPQSARNALGILTLGGGGGAPTTAEYITSSPDATLTAERVLTNTATVTWDFSTAGQAKANAAAGYITSVSSPLLVTGGNLTIDLTPYLTSAAAAAAYQPLDADLTAIAALTGTNTIYYRSAANTWSPVTIGGNMTFSGGTLNSVAGGGGNVSNAGTPTSGQIAQWTSATTIQGVASATIGFGPPQGRLTLQSATPVMTTTQSAKTTIYYSAYCGNMVPLYDGTSFTMTSTGAEISVATTDTTKSPAAIGASKVNDWFVWNDAGTVRLGHGPDWTSDTARSAGTALSRVNGILLNNASITNGPAAQRGTYVGTTRSNASSQLDFIFASSAASGGAGFIGVWNAYNRIDVGMLMNDSTSSWSSSGASWRAANGSSTARISFVIGLIEDCASAIYQIGAVAGSGGSVNVGVGLDSTTLAPAGSYMEVNTPYEGPRFGHYTGNPGLGLHFVQAMEIALVAAATFYSKSANVVLGGLHFRMRA